MLAPSTTKQGQSVVLIHDLPVIQQIALQASTQTLPYDAYRSWYLDKFYPNKALQAQLLIGWLTGLVKKHPTLNHLNTHRKVMISHIERKGTDHYYLRAKVYAMPDLEGCKVEANIANGQITSFELLSYFSFERHHEKVTPYPWKSFLVLGKKDGEFSMYYPSGQLMQKGCFNSGNRVGLWKYYSEEGEVLREEVYGFAEAV